MGSAAMLLEQHFKWLVDDHQQWQNLIADDVVWELPYAPSLGHPGRLVGREAVVRHALWFISEVSDFRFHDAWISALADPRESSGVVKATGQIRSTGRAYEQEYVVFLAARDGKIAHLREYFNPVQAAVAMDAEIAAIPAGSI
ncbi:nuclear transport factor 2 family protein [Cupriavidus necator]|uniref:nuclear transport factor 2 family protein n=1 Tax=Cupriavidus necator TaxID=106590 RepID=UPI0005B557EF|nr:nuclear transport factor 2 family protein [Cupriavidus necator]